MATKIGTFKKTIIEHLPPNTWVNIQDIYSLVAKKVSLESEDFDPSTKYNKQERWKRNVRNALQSLKTNGTIKWDQQNSSYLLVSSKKFGKHAGPHSDLLSGVKLYEQRARLALPLLVRQARSQKTIYYSDLAEELGMPNARNLNYVLGAIGTALQTLAKRTRKAPIPVINCLVINKSDNLPGGGITEFTQEKNFNKLTRAQKRIVVDRYLGDVYTYADWYWVLDQLGLGRVKSDYNRKFKLKGSRKFRGKRGGESPDHKRFKKYVARNPGMLGLSPRLKGKIEYELPSMDKIDVLFQNGKEMIGVEVKSRISDENDIARGLFQCVKYQALLEAEQKVNDLYPNCRVILVLETGLPSDLIGLRNQLGIEVFVSKRSLPL